MAVSTPCIWTADEAKGGVVDDPGPDLPLILKRRQNLRQHSVSS